MIEIFLPVVPPTTTHQAKKIVHIKSKSGKTFSKLADEPELNEVISGYLSLLRPYAPAKPMTGAIRLYVKFVFPWRKSELKRNIAKGEIPKTTKPDCSNMLKTLEDVLERLLFFLDDAQVFAPAPEKYWGDNVGITIRIEEVGK